MRTLSLVVVLFAVTACDELFLAGPPRDIDIGGPTEGEGEGGEGEGEGEACTADVVVTLGSDIAMTTPRTRHSAVLLADGQVLLAGGTDDGFAAIASSELFDPTSGTFTATGALLQARHDFAMVALDDGRAIAFGGFNNDAVTPDDNGDLATAEIFENGIWSAGPAMPEARVGLSAIKTKEGKVLVFGGSTNNVTIPTGVLLFDPAGDTLLPTSGNITTERTAHTAHLLSDGRTLMIGGFYQGSLADVDVISAAGLAQPTEPIPGIRRSPCAANDQDGNLLAFGGLGGGGAGGRIDIQRFFVAEDTWAQAAEMSVPRFGCETVELSCASLVCGGVDQTSCEVWQFASDRLAPALADIGAEFSFSLTRIDGTHALVAGGFVGDSEVVDVGRVITIE